MDASTLTVIFHPNMLDMRTIEKWLRDEENKYDEGFYCNWNLIEDAFRTNSLIILRKEDSIIGFMTYVRFTLYTMIDIVEIERNSRQKGLGRHFINQVSLFFKEQNSKALFLFCEPRSSEFFWRKNGFTQFPDIGNLVSDLTFYKPLIEVEKLTYKPSKDKLELWNVEPYQTLDILPKWTWNLGTNDGKLNKPILHPCNCNWNLRWTRNGEIIRENKVKYFSESGIKIDFGPFLFIDQLN